MSGHFGLGIFQSMFILTRVISVVCHFGLVSFLFRLISFPGHFGPGTFPPGRFNFVNLAIYRVKHLLGT